MTRVTPVRFGDDLTRACLRCALFAPYAQYAFTGLIYAAMHGHVETARALLEARADVDAKSGSGKTALDYARDESRGLVIEMLQDARQVTIGPPTRTQYARMSRAGILDGL